MTYQVLFIQGGGEGAHDKWDNRIVESLERELGPDYAVRYPRMPDEAAPKYTAWTAALERQFDRLDDGAILIGGILGPSAGCPHDAVHGNLGADDDLRLCLLVG
jgi:hypothetical protein